MIERKENRKRNRSELFIPRFIKGKGIKSSLSVFGLISWEKKNEYV